MHGLVRLLFRRRQLGWLAVHQRLRSSSDSRVGSSRWPSAAQVQLDMERSFVLKRVKVALTYGCVCGWVDHASR